MCHIEDSCESDAHLWDGARRRARLVCVYNGSDILKKIMVRVLREAKQEEELDLWTRIRKSAAQRRHPELRKTNLQKTVEAYTAAIPSSAYLGVAVGAMGLSLLCQMTGRGKWGNFIAQWVPTLLIIGLYNKVVKVEGHDRTDRGSAAH